MKNIQALIDKRGGFDAVYENYICIENPPFMKLCVEVIKKGPHNHIVSVAHYGEQGGDPMRDPDIVFSVTPSMSGGWQWYPIGVRNDYAGIDEEYQAASQKSLDCAVFADQWDLNLKEQGFFDL